MAAQGRLVNDVLKQASSVTVEPVGAYENFSATGGDAYIGNDKFTYTGYTLGTDSFDLTGCVGIDYSHNAGDNVSEYYGVRFRDIAPEALKYEANDPDGLADAIMTIIEQGMFKYLKDGIISVHENVDPNRAKEKFLKYICSNNGLESNENMPVAMQRSLARQAANVLKLRGTVNAFKFMVWNILGYEVEVDIERAKVNLRLNDRNYRFMIEPTEMVISDKTVAYWKFTEGSGVSVSNEISGGNSFTLANAAMWNTDCMFRKDTAIEIGGVHTYMETTGSALSADNLHGKSKFRLRWFMKPTSFAAAQVVLYKGTMLVISRPSATDLKVQMSDGVITKSYTFTDCITDLKWNYVSLQFDRPTMTLVVDNEVIGSSIDFDLDTVDDGSSWIFGDKTGVAEFRGLIDTFMIDVGVTYVPDSIKYFEHIDILRSFDTDSDRNCYLFDESKNNGFAVITVTNGDGDKGKLDFLLYLIEEWLTISNYSVEEVAHLPLELEMNLFKHERII